MKSILVSYVMVFLVLGDNVTLGQTTSHFGVEFEELGGASASVIGDNVVISEFGESGNDGVRVVLPASTSSAHFEYEPIAIGDSAELTWDFRIEEDAEMATLEKYQLNRVSPDLVQFSTILPSADMPVLSRGIEGYRDGVLVYEADLPFEQNPFLSAVEENQDFASIVCGGACIVGIAAIVVGAATTVLTSTTTTTSSTVDGVTTTTTSQGPDWSIAVPADIDGDGEGDVMVDELFIVTSYIGELPSVSEIDITGTNVPSITVDSLSLATVPEPCSLMLLLFGMFSATNMRRRRRPSC